MKSGRLPALKRVSYAGSVELAAVYDLFNKVPTAREAPVLGIIEATVSGLGYSRFSKESRQRINQLKVHYILRRTCRRRVIAELTAMVGVVAVREGILRYQHRCTTIDTARFAQPPRKRMRAYSGFTCYEDPPPPPPPPSAATAPAAQSEEYQSFHSRAPL